jgi:hypothetical protein
MSNGHTDQQATAVSRQCDTRGRQPNVITATSRRSEPPAGCSAKSAKNANVGVVHLVRPFLLRLLLQHYPFVP